MDLWEDGGSRNLGSNYTKWVRLCSSFFFNRDSNDLLEVVGRML